MRQGREVGSLAACDRKVLQVGLGSALCSRALCSLLTPHIPEAVPAVPLRQQSWGPGPELHCVMSHGPTRCPAPRALCWHGLSPRRGCRGDARPLT